VTYFLLEHVSGETNISAGKSMKPDGFLSTKPSICCTTRAIRDSDQGCREADTAEIMGAILSRKDLKKELEGLKEQGKRIVFTNGCFDILHVGHVRLPEGSKSTGRCPCVVGINSDDSVGHVETGTLL